MVTRVYAPTPAWFDMDPIVVVGGGIVGSGLAYQLRDAPTDVTLFEKGALGSGTTAASIAMFSWLQSDPDRYTHDLMAEAWETYRSLVDRGVVGFERIGALTVAETPDYLEALRDAAAELREYGLSVEMRTPAELEAFGIDPTEVEGAIYLAEEGYLDPHEIVQHWVREATDAGVRVETGVEVTDVRVEDGSVTGVETTEGTVDAGTVLNAAGPWAPSLNGMVGVEHPLRHTYGRILVLQCAEPFDLPFVSFESGDYFRSEGTRQAFAGRLEKDYASAVREDPDAAHPVEDAFRRDVARNAARFLPVLEEAEVVNEWVGLRTVTPDKKPIVGPTSVEGFHVATGMSGLGVTLAPSVTAHLAEYVLTGEPNATVERLSADRFE